jgi:hypothetical protein
MRMPGQVERVFQLVSATALRSCRAASRLGDAVAPRIAGMEGKVAVLRAAREIVAP